jgi:hypothetical protein
MKRDTRIAIFVLAVLGLAGLLNVTWMLGRISRGIVGQDEIWALMDQRGLHAEHQMIELFNLAQHFILPLEIILGGRVSGDALAGTFSSFEGCRFAQARFFETMMRG